MDIENNNIELTEKYCGVDKAYREKAKAFSLMGLKPPKPKKKNKFAKKRGI